MEISMPASAPEDYQIPAGAEGRECALPEGFVYLDEAIEGVYWDAKYASDDNFTGAPVTGYESNRIALSRKMVSALIKARDLAAEQGYLLLVWDAARPQRAVDRFVEWSGEPEDGKTKDAHYPELKKTSLFKNGYIAKHSGHSRGASIDLTLMDETGAQLDMGGIFDLMDEKSHHGAAGLTKAQTHHRKTLREIMEACGFAAYQNEWWHYTLENEPFPGQYFDFAIGGTSKGPSMPMAEPEITPAPVDPKRSKKKTGAME